MRAVWSAGIRRFNYQADCGFRKAAITGQHEGKSAHLAECGTFHAQHRGERVRDGIPGRGLSGERFSSLTQTGLDPTSLELELTETVLMKRADSISSILKKSGQRRAHRDRRFWNGLLQLELPAKVSYRRAENRPVVCAAISATPSETAIVSAIISMGRSLNLRVIGEGVETAAELAFLQANQCDAAQGFFFSKPVPAKEFAKLLATGVGIPYLQNS